MVCNSIAGITIHTLAFLILTGSERAGHSGRAARTRGRTELHGADAVRACVRVCVCVCARSLFLQFIHRVLLSRKPTTFFDDEFRNPIFTHDIVAIVQLLVERSLDFGRTSAHKSVPPWHSPSPMERLGAEIRV